jgi:hypothetical protein
MKAPSWLKVDEKSRLMVGVRRHGLAAWAAIEGDADLGLAGKLLRAPPANADPATVAKERGKDQRALNRVVDEIVQVCRMLRADAHCRRDQPSYLGWLGPHRDFAKSP